MKVRLQDLPQDASPTPESSLSPVQLAAEYTNELHESSVQACRRRQGDDRLVLMACPLHDTDMSTKLAVLSQTHQPRPANAADMGSRSRMLPYVPPAST